MVRLWGRGDIYQLLVGVQIGTAIMQTIMEISQKSKSRPTILPSDSSPVCMKGVHTLPQRNLHICVYSCAIHHSQKCNQLMNGW